MKIIKNIVEVKATKGRGVLRPGEHRLKAGKALSGGIWLELDQFHVEMSPQQALTFATGILKEIGINVEFDYPN